MTNKSEILAMLRSEFDHWEEVLNSLSVEQITAPKFISEWSIQDTVAHLMAWQKRSIARLEAPASIKNPSFPAGRCCRCRIRGITRMNLMPGFIRLIVTSPGRPSIPPGELASSALWNWRRQFPKRTCLTRKDLHGWQASPSQQFFRAHMSITRWTILNPCWYCSVSPENWFNPSRPFAI